MGGKLGGDISGNGDHHHPFCHSLPLKVSTDGCRKLGSGFNVRVLMGHLKCGGARDGCLWTCDWQRNEEQDTIVWMLNAPRDPCVRAQLPRWATGRW